MTLTELINACGGDTKVMFQSLDKTATALNYSAKKGTSITFGTDAKLTPEGTDMLGLVVWLDRDLVKKAMDGK